MNVSKHQLFILKNHCYQIKYVIGMEGMATQLTSFSLYKIFSSAVILWISFFFFHLKDFKNLVTALLPFSFFLLGFGSLESTGTDTPGF